MQGNALESNLSSQNQQAVSAILSYIAQSKSKRVVARFGLMASASGDTP